MQALIVYNAGVRRSEKGKQYTIRDVPSKVDEALRRRAKREGKSLNQVAVEALTLAVGLAEERPAYRDLDDLAGTWVADPEFDAAVEAQDRVDSELWK
jgi:plasmid stability protein